MLAAGGAGQHFVRSVSGGVVRRCPFPLRKCQADPHLGLEIDLQSSLQILRGAVTDRTLRLSSWWCESSRPRSWRSCRVRSLNNQPSNNLATTDAAHAPGAYKLGYDEHTTQHETSRSKHDLERYLVLINVHNSHINRHHASAERCSRLPDAPHVFALEPEPWIMVLASPPHVSEAIDAPSQSHDPSR